MGRACLVVLASVVGVGCFSGGGGGFAGEGGEGAGGTDCPARLDCAASSSGGGGTTSVPDLTSPTDPAAGSPGIAGMVSGPGTAGVPSAGMIATPTAGTAGVPQPTAGIGGVAGMPVPAGSPPVAGMPAGGTGGTAGGGGAAGSGAGACLSASYQASAECQSCFCGSCMPMTVCDDACWSLALCVADSCPTGAGDINCVINSCSAYVDGVSTAATVLSSCGSSCTDVCGTTVPTGGSGGSGGTGGTGGTTGGTGGMVSEPGPALCDACLSEGCSEIYNSCAADPTCAGGLECALGCGLADINCVLGCPNAFVSLDLLSCGSTACAVECSY